MELVQLVPLVRDLLLILVALSSLLALVLAIALFFQVRALLHFLRTEVSPILGSVRRTTATVETTTRFVGRRALRPLVTLIGILVAARRVLQALSGGEKR